MIDCLRYFTHDELVTPDLAKKGAEFCFGLFYGRLLTGLDQLRHDVGFPIFVNDWAIGGSRKYSGYRPRNCQIGAENSYHKAGGALDLHTHTPEQLAALIARVKAAGYMYGIRRIENPDITKTWLHIDCKEHARVGLHVFNP